MDSALQRVNAIPAHCRPNSERLMRVHGVWRSEWDETTEDAQEAPGVEALVKEAYELYALGHSPISVRWALGDKWPALSAREIGTAQRRAERALQAAEQAPPELRRAMVAAQRQRAIQGALAAGHWGAAIKALERAGDVAGELREAAGLTEEDLVLAVVVEDASGLPAGESLAAQ